MARKPINLEMQGGKNPRQRIWEAIRSTRDGFRQREVAIASRTEISAVQDYMKGLLKGGYVEVEREERLGGAAVRRTYRLVRDNGVEAPRLTRSGNEVVQGSINEAMWSTMRRMFIAQDFNHVELAAFASTASCPISEATAATYVGKLAAAGYLECIAPANKHSRYAAPARYRLRKNMESGPKAPLVQRTKVVFDPNWNRVMWMEHQEIADE
ncbi:hypothetical protein [Burkholderia sp. BDU5]|uniref:hypothetical protein n=1 Tax=Burkholderia sp. BDU5 TaxID=1385590 RepID=UPI00075BF02D|nr:hypothetical protein [Burkholderia sp. BDU5]KVE36219.1 hypothetical protein WS69_13435 [Burkholderia sp. BDU5]